MNLKKANTEKRLVYGVVYEPDLIDTDGDSANAEVIEQMAHNYLADFSKLNIQHETPITKEAEIVESYIAPIDFKYPDSDTLIKQGSWILVVYISSNEIWEKIKSGEITGFSFEGDGVPAEGVTNA